MIFSGKRVVIIGPAPLIENETKIIRGCDLVVRINQALPIPTSVRMKTGDRCDVLYVWRKIAPNNHWKHVKQVRLKSDALFAEDFHSSWKRAEYQAIAEEGRLALIEPEHFYGLSKKIGTRANTGMCALSEIASDNPSFLYITGITFYQSPIAYERGYVSDTINTKITKLKGNFAQHRQLPQLRYFIEKIYPLPFVKCSKELDAIVQRFIM